VDEGEDVGGEEGALDLEIKGEKEGEGVLVGTKGVTVTFQTVVVGDTENTELAVKVSTAFAVPVITEVSV